MEKKQNNSDWKGLIQGFVADMLERVSDNVSNRIHEWVTQMKRRAAGSVIMLLGITYLLTGLSIYADETWGRSIPGLGYIIIGGISLLVGYLVSRK